jgi:AcrR family transcriptional regulator
MNSETTRQRLNREQSREQTRERLLDASRTVFVQKGFALTSVEDIAATAGYTRGAFYSNFTDKTELFVELLRRECENIDREFHHLFQAPLADVVELQEKIANYYSGLYGDGAFSVLWMEAKIVAVRDEKFRATLSLFLEERRAQIAEFVETYARLTNTQSGTSAHHIAIGLMALCEGINIAHRCDPQNVDDKTAEEILSWFLKTTLAMPQQAKQSPAAKVVKTKTAARRVASKSN